SATVATGWGITYEWAFNDGTGPLAGNPLIHVFDDEAVYNVIVTARNSSGMVQFNRPVTVAAALGTTYLPIVRRP
ncbi:MAG: hypothetical protein KDE09_26010, partial [Anaerolineales bacterium]|nr:hypothetical protein [Anaerolineales bacterium]